MLKEEYIFFDQIMIFNEDYCLLTISSSYSPELGLKTLGNIYEQTALWQHYHNTIKAAQAMNVESDLIKNGMKQSTS